MKTVLVPVPPPEEQKAIATALSDVDTLITNLDKLIAKKKAIKQGAMQRLLKSPAQGGQRLPGFEGEWTFQSLGELTTKIGSGITPKGGSTVYKEFGRPFVRSQNIGWGKLLLNDLVFITDEIHATFPNTEIFENDVFLNISGASIGRSAMANEILSGGNVNQHVCIIRPKSEQLDPTFLSAFLLSKDGQKQIDSFQSGGNREGLNIGQIRTFEIPLPPTIDEQKAIASILSDMDKEIESLETKKSKYLRIKQGMMQELLTGKTRLV
ncbi:hypothetical protein AWW67_13460 [Roseivirga seohaensis]|uniref:Type I restriction modification DNA specificity domain-containing protein n=1 Tax=Roseivirga seohaensis TaxID=1914963 RepID=A0A150XLG3_9BACT|nr:hypothetical protein AWW67_13460 [Roseivirga seohaensis]